MTNLPAKGSAGFVATSRPASRPSRNISAEIYFPPTRGHLRHNGASGSHGGRARVGRGHRQDEEHVRGAAGATGQAPTGRRPRRESARRPPPPPVVQVVEVVDVGAGEGSGKM